MNDKEIKEHIAKGYLRCRVIFEMAGNPKEHVENTLKQYITVVKEDPSYMFLSEYYAPTEEHEGVWSTFLEAEILVSGFDRLNLMCFNLSPASVEILEPEAFNFTDKMLTDWYNDLLSKIHEVGYSLKSLTSESDLLKVNLNRAIRNCVILSVNEPKTLSQISESTGIDTEHLQPFIDALIKEKSLVKEGDKYEKKS